jgi:carbamoyltransferase
MLLVAEIQDQKKLEMSKEEKNLFGIDKLNIKRSTIPAITHVDYSARIQTVDRKTNPKYYKLLEKFEELTGCPVLINTSFNVRGEPIVCSPLDAFNCLMGTNLDYLIIENYILRREDQNKELIQDYKTKYQLD